MRTWVYLSTLELSFLLCKMKRSELEIPDFCRFPFFLFLDDSNGAQDTETELGCLRHIYEKPVRAGRRESVAREVRLDCKTGSRKEGAQKLPRMEVFP